MLYQENLKNYLLKAQSNPISGVFQLKKAKFYFFEVKSSSNMHYKNLFS